MTPSYTSARAYTRHLHHEPGEESPSAQTSPGTPFDAIDAQLQELGLVWIAGHLGNGLYSIALTLKAKDKRWQKAYGGGTTLIDALRDAVEHGKSGT